MKKILLMRHCKSDWDFEGLSDHDRPLNTRGKGDLVKIANRLATLSPTVSKVFHSSATRARDTANGVFSLSMPHVPLSAHKSLYTFSSTELRRFIMDLPDVETDVAIVGHNPAMTDLIGELTKIRLDNLPTGGFCYLQFDVGKWSDIKHRGGKVHFLEYPRMLEL